ncbi:MAG TPA: CDP-diacylglycerol--glycerol-3-phosphate 3-phosphatidyltransferase [Bacteroidota bacterium]|nr:CDP-diacylglycerol--glycerol-3-phosphate 3-phosphatidyltransferase [Bacteroidota bacterium]
MKFFSLPNQMTLLRILLTPVFLYLFLSSDPRLKQLSLAVLIFAAFTDWYDGWLARRWGYVTRWGAFFDPLADKVVTSATFLVYEYIGLVPGWTVWIIVVRDILITVLRSYAEYKGNPVDTSKLAKTKTFGQFVVMYYILLGYIGQSTPQLESQYGSIVNVFMNRTVIYTLMVVIAAITLWTGLVYIYDNRKIIRELFPISKKAAEAE